MNVIVFASRKGGTGKSTLAAHLATYCYRSSRSCLLVDADPQGSLTLWHRLRKTPEPPLKNGLRDFAQILADAEREGVEWVLVDTPPLVSAEVSEIICAATLIVIPARPSVFDLTAITETIAIALTANKPFAVVLNGVAPRRLGTESPIALTARRYLASLAPVWSGQISHRHTYALALAEGQSVGEQDSDARVAREEIGGLWTAIDNSVNAIHGAYAGAAMHRRVAA
ncbi:MAG TPA: ParA family protein [Pseudolabrys sp.]|nr:ParA family protein [Pseudolabrys sp.]